ncbi:MAG: hypothetical protein V4580_07425 [Bacteroidota bacterium]
MTYNDSPSGIYSGQVIDVVNFLETDLQTDVKLVALISVRGFFINRNKILAEIPKAIVLPMFPGVRRWRLNFIILSVLVFFYKPKAIIGRSVLATQLALKLKNRNKIQKVVYDGRGAIAAEWKEYNVINDSKMLSEINHLEKEAVLLADFRIAVSHKLISYWENQYGYSSEKHVVIPCTLNEVFKNVIINQQTIDSAQALFGFQETDIVYVYSGSVAGWQSFELLKSFLVKQLTLSKCHKVLFLSENDKHIDELKVQFPTQVFNKKVSQFEVPRYLLAGNFGILIREKSVTNQVASPVKFAEYLCCGLAVIISEDLGDYSAFVQDNNCGALDHEFKNLPVDKHLLHNIALDNFTKQKHRQSYLKLISQLT